MGGKPNKKRSIFFSRVQRSLKLLRLCSLPHHRYMQKTRTHRQQQQKYTHFREEKLLPLICPEPVLASSNRSLFTPENGAAETAAVIVKTAAVFAKNAPKSFCVSFQGCLPTGSIFSVSKYTSPASSSRSFSATSSGSTPRSGSKTGSSCSGRYLLRGMDISDWMVAPL